MYFGYIMKRNNDKTTKAKKTQIISIKRLNVTLRLMLTESRSGYTYFKRCT